MPGRGATLSFQREWLAAGFADRRRAILDPDAHPERVFRTAAPGT
jgi:hypothetical protein